MDARGLFRSFRPYLERLEDRSVFAVITVDAAAGLHAIDPNIYGVAFASTDQLNELNATLNRYGGNTSTRYNWQLNLDNKGSDWFFESLPGDNDPGGFGDSFISDTLNGGAQPMLTIPMIDYVAWTDAGRNRHSSFSVATYGPQQATDFWMPDAGNGIRPNGTRITGNNPLDASTPNSVALQRGWLEHLASTWGDASNGGVRYYFMDNEPALWHETHRDVFPTGLTHTQLRDKFIAYATMVKQEDPNALILGPEEWGWTNYFVSGLDAQEQDWGATYNGLQLMPWYLDELRQNHQLTGTRLMDYFTLHFYPQAGQFSDNVATDMQLLRNRSTRSLWDPTYVDESWINTTGINGGRVNLINLMQGWVDTYYPGTKTGITEYNWGAEGHMNGATTQADIWGIFGREGLDLANRWTTPETASPTYLAMKMFGNYDGTGGAFGDTSVQASVANPDQVSAFASLRAADGALTIMVVNKNLVSQGASTSITINVNNFANTGAAQTWRLAAVNPSNLTQASITHPGDVSFAGNSLTYSSPNQSVQIFVLLPSTATPPATPTGPSADAGNTQVVLSWNAAAGATSYNIYRSTVSGGTTLHRAGVTAATFVDTGLANGTTYYYQVSAVNAAGESSKSGEVFATPEAPVTSDSIFINFTTASGEGVAGYLTDIGQVFGARGNGLEYGWNKPNLAAARDRDSALSPSELHDSFNRMKGRRWDIAVANGTYQVHVSAGDPSTVKARYKIKVENVVAINGRQTRARRWPENTVTVTVTDGRLTLRNAWGVTSNKINFIEITPVPALLVPAFDRATLQVLE